MANLPILRLALPTPLRRLFDYLPPEGIDNNTLIPGVRVRVPFQSRELVGVLVGVEKTSSLPYGKLKRALSVLDSESLFSEELFKLCQWASDYYHYSLGEVLASALPATLRKGEAAFVKNKREKAHEVFDTPHALNEAQQNAVNEMIAAEGGFKTFLLDGVTGSGKTEVYLQAITSVLQKGKQALLLVPEISLTPQTIHRFRSRFREPVVTLHSALSAKERLRAWLAARSGEAKIVIGTRSAIFTPMANLGLMIVDEEHDTSFKQQDRFRYHARDLAVMRAHLQGLPVVLGSATPSLESLVNVKRGRYSALHLPMRAGEAKKPTFELIDIRVADVDQGLSQTLIKAMHAHLAQGNQVMLFLNRRGYAPVLYCPECSWIAGCDHCDARMVYHQSPPRLQCHHCDKQSKIPLVCEECGVENLQPIGLGTQRLENALTKCFPDVPIIRIDRDTTRRKGSMQDLLAQIHEQKSAILLGTQMLAKGHHFPQVTLVGIVDADSGLFSSDFRAAEQMGQLLLQVAGRAGREEKQGEVLIQTRHPTHPLLQQLIKEGYAAFAESLLIEREAAHLPPYSYFAVFRAEAYRQEKAADFLLNIKQMLEQITSRLTILGPVQALMAKRRGLHCEHLIIKAPTRHYLQEGLTQVLAQLEQHVNKTSVKWVLDVDPIDI